MGRGRRPIFPLRRSVALAILLVMVGLAPGGASAAQAPDAEPNVVHLYAGDFNFVVDRSIIPGGPVEFVLLNLSPDYRHEVWIYPVDERDSIDFHGMLHLKRTGERASETDYIGGIVARSGEVQAGESVTFSADLPPGVYELACLAREGTGGQRMVHYDAGMFAALIVRDHV